MLWWKRYEPLLEAKPVAGEDVLVDMIAKELVEIFEQFPPAPGTVDFEDDAMRRRFADNLATLPQLDTAMVGCLCRIVRLDLSHEIEAIDHLFRNDHHRDAAPTPMHVEALHFLWRLVVEHLLSRKDDTKGIFKTKHLLAVVDKAEARYRANRMRIS